MNDLWGDLDLVIQLNGSILDRQKKKKKMNERKLQGNLSHDICHKHQELDMSFQERFCLGNH